MSIRQATMTTAIVMALAMTAVVLPGCGAVEAPVDLNGTEWRLVSWSDTEVDPTPHEITLSLADGQASGRAPVNSYTGGFEFTPEGAFSTSEIAQTLMAGSDEAMQAETVYMGLLGNVDSFRMEGANLVLVGDGTDLLEFEPVQ